MHQTAAPAAPKGPVHQERAYEFVECPMKAAAQGNDINLANMVTTTRFFKTFFNF